MSTIDDNLSNIIDEYIKNYCEIDGSEKQKWFVSTKSLCHHFKITTKERISISTLGSYINANYDDVIKLQKRIPFMDGKQIVLTNLIISENKEQFEEYFREKKKEKLQQKNNEKVIKINNDLHEILINLKFNEYKTIPEKMEIILSHYIDNTSPVD